jgi:hypothetical protein
MNFEEVTKVYKEYLVVDFPEDEVKPLDKILRLMKEGKYITWGFYKEEELLAYAWFCIPKDSSLILLDYLSVCCGNRGRGYGSRFLRMLKHFYENKSGIILEAEDVAYAPSKEQEAERLSRIHFYEKNGLRVTKIRAEVFGVNYIILVYNCGGSPTDEEVLGGLEAVYHTFLSSNSYNKNVKFNL